MNKNSNEKLVSVLIPIHGPAPYLEKVIESIRCQESVEIELVVVLDRPTASLKVQTELLLADLKKTKLLVSPGSGISEALNFGLEHCQSRYVARIDSDDEMIKGRLIKQKEFLDNNPMISSVGTQIIKISEDNRIIGHSRYPNSAILVGRIMRIRNCVAHPSVMYRRDDVLSIGGYRSAFDGAEDYDLWIRLTRKGRLANLNECLTKYRIWKGQDTIKYISEKNVRAFQVQLFAELEEIAPRYAIEILSERLNTENLIDAAEKYLREHAVLRWHRLRSVSKLNVALSRKDRMLDVKSVSVLLVSFFKQSLFSLLIRFTGNR